MRGLSGPLRAGPGRGQPGDSPVRADHGDRRERGGQEHPAGPAAAVCRTGRGDHRGWRGAAGGTGPGRVAGPDRLGAAAAAPVRRHGRRQHRPGPARREPARDRARRRPGRRGRIHRGAAARICHPAGRPRRPAVGGAAAADRAGPGVPAGRAAAVARRTGRASGRDHRGGDIRRHRGPAGTPHRRPGQSRPGLGRPGRPDDRLGSRQTGVAGCRGSRRRARPGPGGRAMTSSLAGLGRHLQPAGPGHGPGGRAHRRWARLRGDSLVRVLWLAQPLRRRLILAVLASAVATGCGIALLATSGFLLARASQHPNILAIAIAVVAVRGLSVGRGVFRYAERLASHDAAFRILADVRVRAFGRLERLAPAGLRTLRPGDVLARLVSDVDATQDLFLRGVVPPVAALLAGTGAVIACLLILPASGLALAGGLLAAGALVPWLAAGRARQTGERLAPARGEFTAHFTDVLSGAADLHAFGAAEPAVARAADSGAELASMERRAASGMGLGTALSSGAAGLTVWAVLGLAVAATGTGALTRVPLAVVTLTALAAFEAVTALPAAAIQLGQARASAARVTSILDAPDPVRDPAAPLPLPAGPVRVRLRGAQVRYEPGGPLALGGAVGSELAE